MCHDRGIMPCPARLQEAEGLVGELSGVVQQQKLRLRGLAQERAEACARLQAMNPQVRATRCLVARRLLALAQATSTRQVQPGLHGSWHARATYGRAIYL